MPIKINYRLNYLSPIYITLKQKQFLQLFHINLYNLITTKRLSLFFNIHVIDLYLQNCKYRDRIF